MAKVGANGIQIEYETFGDPNSRPLLLIIGFATQLIFWDEKLCGQIAQEDHNETQSEINPEFKIRSIQAS
jgi:hypothetical protein